jgi:hypothetical protein
MSAGIEASFMPGGFSSKKRLEMDAQVTALCQQSQAGCQDLALLHSLMHTVGGKGAPNYIPVVERIHILSTQTLALAHGGFVEPEHWQCVADRLDEVRREMATAMGHFQVAFRRSFSEAVGETLGLDALDLRTKTVAEMKEAAEVLKRARVALTEATIDASDPEMCPRKHGATKTKMKMAAAGHSGGLEPMGGDRVTEACREPGEWCHSRRLGAFLHGLELVVSDLAVLALVVLRSMDVPDEEVAALTKYLAEVTVGPGGTFESAVQVQDHQAAFEFCGGGGGDEQDGAEAGD